jgi:hypothetical protein
MRHCGGCTACCKLLPMEKGRDVRAGATALAAGVLTMEEINAAIPDFDKKAGARCPYQRTGKGCSVYDRRPLGCRFWVCRWLANDDTADMSRPDRAHYVIDMTPDFVTTASGESIAVIQIWIDPDYPNAHEDPALRAFLERRGHEGYAALIRYNKIDAFFLCPPSMSDDGQWHVREGHSDHREHSLIEKIQTLGLDAVLEE